MKLTIAFWNILKRTLDTRIIHILKNYEVDILLLAECTRPSDDFLEVLSSATGQPFSEANLTNTSKVRVFYKSENIKVSEHWDSLMGDFTAKRVKFEGRSLLLFGVHFPSELGSSKEAQLAWAVDVVKELRRIEFDQGHSRSIVIGDFNMSPYHFGLTGTKAFSAVTCKKDAKKLVKYGGVKHSSFYNPMWNLLGDNDGPPGTRVHKSAGNTLKWHIIDQALVRSSLANCIDRVRILDSDGEKSLLTSHGNPDVNYGSDHLPILLELDLKELPKNE